MRLRMLCAIVGCLAAACGRNELALGGARLPPPDGADCGAPWLLFSYSGPVTGNESRIYARRADGTGGHVVALPQLAATYPSVTPDGSALLYTDASVTHLFLYRFSDHTNRQLDTTGTVGSGNVSPDGQTVVYGDGNNLWLVGLNGTPAQHVLVPASSAVGGAAGYPAFLADSRTVVFATGGEVRAIQIDGSNFRTVLTNQAVGTFPNVALSPDRQQLAAMVSCDGVTLDLRAYSVASFPAPCGAGRVVTPGIQNTSYYELAWGPSDQIAYSNGPDVFIVPAAGGTPTNFTADVTGTTSLAGVGNPTWVPACADLP